MELIPAAGCLLWEIPSLLCRTFRHTRLRLMFSPWLLRPGALRIVSLVASSRVLPLVIFLQDVSLVPSLLQGVSVITSSPVLSLVPASLVLP